MRSDPGAVRTKGDWCTWPESTMSGCVALDPLRQFGVAEIAGPAPADRRLVRRRVMDPDPPLAAPRRRRLQLPGDVCPHDGTVPPGATGDRRVIESERLPVRENAVVQRVAEPTSDFLAVAVGVEIVIAGADHELGLGTQPAEIFLHHDALRASVDERADVEMVAGHHHKIVLARPLDHPVELRQRVVQIGDKQDSHRSQRGSSRIARIRGKPLIHARP